jgi:hypothetical protein
MHVSQETIGGNPANHLVSLMIDPIDKRSPEEDKRGEEKKQWRSMTLPPSPSV